MVSRFPVRARPPAHVPLRGAILVWVATCAKSTPLRHLASKTMCNLVPSPGTSPAGQSAPDSPRSSAAAARKNLLGAPCSHRGMHWPTLRASALAAEGKRSRLVQDFALLPNVEVRTK